MKIIFFKRKNPLKMLQENNYLTLVDAHVHIYDCYDIRNFFLSAFNNFSTFNKSLGGSERFTGVLFLTESNDYDYFGKFFEEPEKYSLEINYKILRTGENTSLIISADKNNIVLVAGRQLVTNENLEVLALGTREKFLNVKNRNASEVISSIIEADAIPVLPWGVGKWLGSRGKVIKELIKGRDDFFLGDNSGRPFIWPSPKLFNEGSKKNIFTLRGTDPLPIKAQEGKAGRFGLYFYSDTDLNQPAMFIKNKLSEAGKNFNNYGRLENISDFFKNQLLMKAS